MNSPIASPKVLVAPLDWGLGHATRCVPVIRELLHQRCAVVVGAAGRTKALLQAEFPGLQYLHLPGYEIEYASSGWGLPFKIVAQIPKIIDAIDGEERWLETVVNEAEIDAVISDNRYGLHHPNVRSVFLTHQLRIQAPARLAEDFLQRLNYDYINRFDECWVPDAAGENNLAGLLSHPPENPEVPLHYIGALSRFGPTKAAPEKGYLLVLLSGPEPQRTLLEQLVLENAGDFEGEVVLVRGLPGDDEPLPVPENVNAFNHLPATELEEKLRGASLVIARCGYSTVMDLAALRKRSILIPTPGQSEQEYLARHLMTSNVAFCVEQKKFRLKNILPLVRSFPFRPFPVTGSGLTAAVRSLVSHLASHPQKPHVQDKAPL